MLLRAPLRALALALALAATACSAEVGPEDDAAEEADGEGGEQVSEEALRLGDANRQGFKEPQFSTAEKAAVLARYGSIDPNREVPRVLLENALQYYDFNKSRLKVKDVITIIDFSQHSSKRRMYIVDKIGRASCRERV